MYILCATLARWTCPCYGQTPRSKGRDGKIFRGKASENVFERGAHQRDSRSQFRRRARALLARAGSESQSLSRGSLRARVCISSGGVAGGWWVATYGTNHLPTSCSAHLALWLLRLRGCILSSQSLQHRELLAALALRSTLHYCPRRRIGRALISIAPGTTFLAPRSRPLDLSATFPPLSSSYHDLFFRHPPSSGRPPS